MPFNYEMIILNDKGEIHIPITDYQHQLLQEKLEQFEVKKAYIFADEETLNKEIDNAIQYKLF